MKINLEIDSSNKKDLTEAAAIIALLQGGLTVTTSEKAPAKTEKKTEKPTKKTAKPVEPEIDEDEEELEEDEEISFDSDEDEEELEEDEDDLSDEDEEEVEEDDEDEKPTKKPASKKTPAKEEKKPGMSLETVLKAFQDTNTKLIKKFKSKEKAQKALNKVLKAHGAASTRKLDPKKYNSVMKELKTLAA